jgi:hypothetical protein
MAELQTLLNLVTNIQVALDWLEARVNIKQEKMKAIQ